MNNRETFRPRSSYLWFGVAAVLDALFVAERLSRGVVQTAIAGLFLGAAIGIGAYLLFIRPKIDVFDEAVVITNIITDEVIGWQDVIDVETRYSMTVVTADRKILAIAAPAPSRYHSRTVHASELKGISIRDTTNIRPSDSPRTHSGVAAHITRLRWETFNRGDQTKSIESHSRRNIVPASIMMACLAIGVILEAVHL